jgi:hypothetical protein
MKSPPLYLEFNGCSLKTFTENTGTEFPLERTPDGRLTAASREKTAAALKHFLKARSRPARSEAWCAIDARGVSLRRLLLPALPEEKLHALVRMQIESEFPLSPDELAWGYQLSDGPQPQPDGTFKQAVLVAAVKKEIIEDYAVLLTAAGVTAAFTVAALARTVLCPRPPSSYAILEPGPEQSELAGFEDGGQVFVRLLPPVKSSDYSSLEVLAKAVDSQWRGRPLYIFGREDIAAPLARRLADAMVSDPLHHSTGDGSSYAILGLKKIVEEQGGVPLTLQVKPAAGLKQTASPVLVEWGVRAALLLLAVLLFPYLEALFLAAPLSGKVAAFQARAEMLETNVDRDLEFLQYLKQNQPPYLECYYVLAKAAPQGIHLESLSLNRRGEMALRGTLRNGDQVADFRSKLIASGFFASVTVEDQTPAPNHQQVTVRMTGQWKPLVQLQALAVGPTPAELGGETNNAEATLAAGPMKKAVPGPSTNKETAAKIPPASGLSTNHEATAKAMPAAVPSTNKEAPDQPGPVTNLSTNMNKGGTN